MKATPNTLRYLAIVEWARKRYTESGRLVLFVGGTPSKYTLIECMAWGRYIIEKDEGNGPL